MPKDYWAAARRKDLVRRALRTGEFFSTSKKLVKVKKRRRRPQPGNPLTGDVCRRCQSPLTVQMRTFKDGTTHIESRCTKCGKFHGFLPQTDENMDIVFGTQADYTA